LTKSQKLRHQSVWDWCHNPCFGSTSLCNSHHKNIMRRACERGVREIGLHRTRAREELGPAGMMKVRTLSFSVIKPKITSVQTSCQYHN